MQLLVNFPTDPNSSFEEGETVTVRAESDITKAGFAAARAVRAWLRRMPFTPSTGDLHFNVYAEVVPDDKAANVTAVDGDAPKPKRKRKKEK